MSPPNSIVAATASYERWLGSQVDVIRADLQAKHRAMAADPFSFLRATYYRWAQVWSKIGREWAGVSLPGIGDLHIENFGTWRDAEGRLVWGVNDFDECGRVAFTNDLVRLATSALLACRQDRLRLTPTQSCDAIWHGYADSLASGGGPYVLAEKNAWLRTLAATQLREPGAFWEKFEPHNAPTATPPPSVAAKLKASLPPGSSITRIVHRQSGLGSLGRGRYAAVALWNGARIAREAKAIVTNGADWARNKSTAQPQNMQRMITHSLRGIDPFNHVDGEWVLRRLSPDCVRIELDALAKAKDEGAILHAMGAETANAHLSTRRSTTALKAAASNLGRKWLLKAATAMMDATVDDWKAWKKHQRK